jgi:hypothetical protein
MAYALDNNTVSITATGTVARACTVALDSGNSSETKTLGDLTASGSNVQIGTVKETCNDNAGYKVTLTSNNNGALKGATTSATIPYTLTYGGTAVTFSAGSATVSTATAPTGSTPPTNAVALIWTGSPTLTADSYSDTLTFTMAAN